MKYFQTLNIVSAGKEKTDTNKHIKQPKTQQMRCLVFQSSVFSA